MQFVAELGKRDLRFLGLAGLGGAVGLDLLLYLEVEDVLEYDVFAFEVRKLAEVNLAVGQEDSLVLGFFNEALITKAAEDREAHESSNSDGYHDQRENQQFAGYTLVRGG